ncbi:uncharacterized protein [Mytilus edulis]|uniref:uncharacterized protein n=1 Tax=Mytilus edulis TaxID=6550 RepID=UPI0039EFBC72
MNTLLISAVLLQFIQICTSASCSFDKVVADPTFNINKFLEVWYEHERTTFQWGVNGTWHSSVWNWIQGGDGNTYMAYGGFSTFSKTYSTARTGLISGSNGSYILTAENIYEASLQIVYTDYTIALVYMCYAKETNGNCQMNKVHVAFLGRHKQLSAHQRQQLVSHLDGTCIQEHDIIKSDLGKPYICYCSYQRFEIAGIEDNKDKNIVAETESLGDMEKSTAEDALIEGSSGMTIKQLY